MTTDWPILPFSAQVQSTLQRACEATARCRLSQALKCCRVQFHSIACVAGTSLWPAELLRKKRTSLAGLHVSNTSTCSCTRYPRKKVNLLLFTGPWQRRCAASVRAAGRGRSSCCARRAWPAWRRQRPRACLVTLTSPSFPSRPFRTPHCPSRPTAPVRQQSRLSHVVVH